MIEEPPVPEERRDRASQRVSITFSPLHLFLPMFEAQVEVMVVPHFGISAIGGIGSVTVDDPTVGKETFSAYELGLQLVGYPLNDFKSLQLGGELMYLRVDTDDFAGQQITGVADGVAVGPLIGYKVLTSGGFTFVAQGGFQYMAVHAEASNTQGQSAQGDTSDFIALLNLNIGWSF